MNVRLFVTLMLLSLNAAYGVARNQTLSMDLLDDAEDDTEAVQALIDSMPEGGSLHIPTGILTLSAPLVIDRKNFAVCGVDANLTFVRCLHAGDGLVFQSSKTGGDNVRVSDITIQAIAKRSGAAIRGAMVGAHEPPGINLDRVRVEGSGNGFWRFGLKMESGEALMVDCDFKGLNDGTSGTQALIEYTGKTGGGGRIQMVRSRLSGAHKGVTVYETDSEGQKFYDSIVENVAIGAERLTAEPTFQWMGCRISAETNVFYFSGVRDTAVSGCLLEVSNPGGKAIVLERRQTQHISFRGNVIARANIVTVNSKDFSGKKSKLVDSISLSGNYLRGAQTAFDLSGPETVGFSFGGNVLQNIQREFVLAGDTKKVRKTKVEEQK